MAFDMSCITIRTHIFLSVFHLIFEASQLNSNTNNTLHCTIPLHQACSSLVTNILAPLNGDSPVVQNCVIIGVLFPASQLLVSRLCCSSCDNCQHTTMLMVICSATFRKHKRVCQRPPKHCHRHGQPAKYQAFGQHREALLM